MIMYNKKRISIKRSDLFNYYNLKNANPSNILNGFALEV